MKTLAFFVHYYGQNSKFHGKSTTSTPNLRRAIVERCLFSLRSLAFVDVMVVGYGEKNLVTPDINLIEKVEDSRHLVYGAFCEIVRFLDHYDYFLIIEDDILVNADIFYNVMHFDNYMYSQGFFTYVLHPNRIEYSNARPFCIDLAVLRAKTGKTQSFNGRHLAEYENPHSGLFLVDRKKLSYVLSQVDRNFRGSVIGGPMASAFAHYHRPLTLFRVSDGFDFHTVNHLDPMYFEKPSIARRTLRWIKRQLHSV